MNMYNTLYDQLNDELLFIEQKTQESADIINLLEQFEDLKEYLDNVVIETIGDITGDSGVGNSFKLILDAIKAIFGKGANKAAARTNTAEILSNNIEQLKVIKSQGEVSLLKQDVYSEIGGEYIKFLKEYDYDTMSKLTSKILNDANPLYMIGDMNLTDMKKTLSANYKLVTEAKTKATDKNNFTNYSGAELVIVTKKLCNFTTPIKSVATGKNILSEFTGIGKARYNKLNGVRISQFYTNMSKIFTELPKSMENLEIGYDKLLAHGKKYAKKQETVDDVELPTDIEMKIRNNKTLSTIEMRRQIYAAKEKFFKKTGDKAITNVRINNKKDATKKAESGETGARLLTSYVNYVQKASSYQGSVLTSLYDLVDNRFNKIVEYVLDSTDPTIANLRNAIAKVVKNKNKQIDNTAIRL